MEIHNYISYKVDSSNHINKHVLTWKQVGGGRSVRNWEAAGGSGNIPPGNGWAPVAVKWKWKLKSQQNNSK